MPSYQRRFIQFWFLIRALSVDGVNSKLRSWSWFFSEVLYRCVGNLLIEHWLGVTNVSSSRNVYVCHGGLGGCVGMCHRKCPIG